MAKEQTKKLPEDKALIASYLNGDEAAFEILVRKHIAFVYNVVQRYVGQSNASDVTQEAFVKIWRNLKKFNQEKDFRTWIFVIAKNASLDWLRLNRTKPIVFSQTPGIENKIQANSHVNSVAEPALDLIKQDGLLPDKYRTIINLRHKEDLTFKEISQRLEESLSTVKSRYRRGLNLIKKYLGLTD